MGGPTAPSASRMVANEAEARPIEAGLVAAALVEEELSDCIARHFVQDNGDYRQHISYMMHPDGVLGAFGAKIDLGWVMGIYGVAAYKNLKLIPKIRNAFAHKIAAGDFDCTLVGAHCDGLTFAEQFLEKNGPDYSIRLRDPASILVLGPQADDPFRTKRDRYLTTCATFMALLGNAAVDFRTHQPLF
jgi:hypothetical protein